METVRLWVVHPQDERLGDRVKRVDAVFLTEAEAVAFGEANPFYTIPRDPIPQMGVLIDGTSAVYVPSADRIVPLGDTQSLLKAARAHLAAEKGAALLKLSPVERCLLSLADVT